MFPFRRVACARWRCCAAVVASLVLLHGTSGAWLATVNGDAPAGDFGIAVVLDTAGGSISVGTSTELGTGSAVTILRRDGSGQELWRQRVAGTMLASGDDGGEPRAVALDAVGDVVVAGRVPNVGSGFDMFVSKLGGVTGVELWRVVIDGTAHAGDRATHLAVDAAGDVVVAAAITDATTSLNAIFLKIRGTDGSEVWRRVLAGTAGRADEPGGVGVDGSGHVAVAATLSNSATGADVVVARLDATTGAPLWGPVVVDGGPTDGVNAIAVDGSGSLLAGGRLRGAGADDDFAVIKFSLVGTELWRRLIPGSANRSDEARALALDAAGDVFAAGAVDSAGTGPDFTLVKLRGSDGVPVGSRTIDGTAHADDRAEAIAVDAAGGVLAGGFTSNGATGYDFTVVRYAPDGALGWLHIVPSEPDPADCGALACAVRYETARSVAVGPGGDLAVGTVRSATTEDDFYAIRIGAASGDVLWEQRIDGSGNGSGDFGEGVAVDGAGQVLAAGATHNVGARGDFTVVAVDGATGSVRWSRRFTGSRPGGNDFAAAIVADAAGDALVAGGTQNDGTGQDLMVRRLRRDDGAELWRSIVSGTNDLSPGDEARALVIDAANDVIVAGSIAKDGGDRGFLVRKLDGGTGGERWTHVATARPAGGSGDVATAVALDAAHDVVTAGILDAGDVRGSDFAVVKLVGAGGAERWHALFDGTATADVARAVAVDAAGDVVAAGVLGLAGSGTALFVVKLAGTDGAERWEYRLEAGGTERRASAAAVAVDPAGDVFVAGNLSPEVSQGTAVVIKLSGVHGGELWRYTATDVATGATSAVMGIAVDVAGDAVVGGLTGSTGPSVPTTSTWLLAKLDGTSGAELWRRSSGTAMGRASMAALVLDAGGNPVVVGSLENAGTSSDLAVAKVSGGTGGERFCGDGARDPGERCDDGNGRADDCCSPTCEPLEVPGVCGAPCATPTDCDDGDPCTVDACDETSHCVHDPVPGDAALTCAFERSLAHPTCRRIPRRLGRMFARAGRLVNRALHAERPRHTRRLYRRAARILAGLSRLVDRAERARRPARRLGPECAAALRSIVGDARSRIRAAAT